MMDSEQEIKGESAVHPPKPTPWELHRAELRAARRPKGRLATLAEAAQRLAGRLPTEREQLLASRKAFKKEQEKMERETKKRYPTPKGLTRRWMKKVNR